ncbi:glycosyltransferase [Moorena producens JHB]|uniref:Glycosyltransferase n=1 Tax=Moorena producens (strain JHB) TaxID=1454205 RepID=A0A1D9G8T1_MOOP1|nr:glycosyltransferase [Moorena producens]AOY83934.2 glycosyltransferase [Moorena producens JHB]
MMITAQSRLITTATYEIVVISSVPPEPTSAGQIILHRHLSQLDGWKVSVVPHPQDLLTRLAKRLNRTRFHTWVNNLNVLTHGRSWDPLCHSHQLSSQKAIVLTVAHGDGCWAALRFAKKYGLPLVTIFHDWWPDLPIVHAPFRQLIARRFQQLHDSSDLVLCVSEGIQKALGSHPNSKILYPIPASLPSEPRSNNSIADKSRPLRVVYSGNLYEYGPMLGELLQGVKDHPSLQVQVRGKNPNWSADVQKEMRERGLWLDFAPRAELNEWLSSADACLVTMSFNPAMRRRMETSFPSKLLEYVQFGKPIVIWGPEYCAAVRWAKEGNKAICVTDKSTNAVISALEQLRLSLEMQKHYGYQAQKTALGEFNPEMIQQKFVEVVTSVI